MLEILGFENNEVYKISSNMVPGAGIEPAQRIAPRDFKSDYHCFPYLPKTS
ncbi:MAG: hypothetical protein Q7T53_01690 [Deltaproteobacteria bacterium]|nr:hypothetical protein [Deltaproteobacteria bacterium]